MTATATCRSILAATDLRPGSETVTRFASTFAAALGARWHAVHVVEADGDRESRQEARALLQAQVEAASLPPGVPPASHHVVTGPKQTALELAAEEAEADLVVVGPHRGWSAGGRLGTTADRLLRASGIPVLVARGNEPPAWKRIGVAVDLSPGSFEALRLAAAWCRQLFAAGRAPELRVVHVGSPVDRESVPDLESGQILPTLEREIAAACAGVHVKSPALVWDHQPAEALLRWAEREEIDLFVLGTPRRSGLARALIGQTAVTVADSAGCAVVLAPPREDVAARPDPALERVLIGVDFGEPSRRAAAWVVDHLAPAETVLAHVVNVPEPPSVLRGMLPPPEQLQSAAARGAESGLAELASLLGVDASPPVVLFGRPADALAAAAHEGGADLLAVGPQGESSAPWPGPGNTAEGVLRTSWIPVLVVQDPADHPPRRILVAVDDSPPARRALAWAAWLAGRYEAELVALHVLSAGLLAPVRRLSSEAEGERLVAESRTAVHAWLRQEMAAAGSGAARASTEVAVGPPAATIRETAERSGADFLVLGRRGAGAARGLGSVAAATLRTAALPVLVVPG